MTILKCGCVVGAYWCAKHDIYTGNVPPWGAGTKRTSESKKVYDAELDDSDRQPECCSCHLSAPCGWCERTQNDEDENCTDCGCPEEVCKMIKGKCKNIAYR